MGTRRSGRQPATRQPHPIRPSSFDIAFAATMTSLGFIDAVADEVLSGERAPDALAFGLIAVAGLSLIWRRLHPVPVAAVVGAAMITFWFRDHGAFLAVLGLPSLYAMAVHEHDRRRAWIGMVTACVAMMVGAGLTVLNPPGGFLFPNAVTMATYLIATVAIGIVVRNRQRIFLDTKRQAEQAVADRQAAAERAVTAERNRIAREIHDVVAHGMSVVAIQAGAAQAKVRSEPDKAIDMLRDIEEASRDSLTEMRRMLGVLRSNHDADDADTGRASLLPQPGITDLVEMIRHEPAIDLTMTGTRRPLSPSIELAVHRIVQESITNVRKHAGPGALTSVTIDFRTRAIRLDITNEDGLDRPTGLGDVGSGNGLIGMRERCEIYGGTFHAGPSPDGGWAVQATLPTDENNRYPKASGARMGGGSP